MWRCSFCGKTNLDDKKICPYCTAPNPDAPKATPASSPNNAFSPQTGTNPPAQDWYSRYNPDQKPPKSPFQLDKILKYMVIAASALLIIYLVTLLFRNPAAKVDAANDTSPNSTVTKAEKALDSAEVTPTSSPIPTPTPEPTRAPVVADAESDLYLDFGQQYQCSTEDFDLPFDIPENEITWRCADNDEGTVCSKHGLIEAGYYQVDPEQKYNKEIIVTGTTKEGSVLSYHVYTGNGETYTFNWSSSARSMRGYISGYTIVCDKMIPKCSEFSVYYEYTLKDGKIDGNTWSVWVRENGTTWVRVKDINIDDPSGEVYTISLDHPMSFNEIWIMPETYSQEFSYSSAFYVEYFLFQ